MQRRTAGASGNSNSRTDSYIHSHSRSDAHFNTYADSADTHTHVNSDTHPTDSHTHIDSNARGAGRTSSGCGGDTGHVGRIDGVGRIVPLHYYRKPGDHIIRV